MPEQRRKKTRGQPEIYDEVKGQVNLSLTKTSIQGLDELASAMGLSRSEFVEQVGRRLIPVLDFDDQELVKQALLQAITIAQEELEAKGAFAERQADEARQSLLCQQISQWRELISRLE